MPLRVARKEGETWRECIERYAKPHGLETEVLSLYDRYVNSGDPEHQAAFDACYEWDICDFVEEKKCV